MKLKYHSPFAGVILLFLLVNFNQLNAATKNSTFVAPVIDGVEDASWSTIAWDSVTHMVTNYKVPFDIKDLSCRFKLAWDNDAFYILAHVTDDVILNPSDPTQIGQWNNDYFEINLDLNNTKLLTPTDKDYTWSPFDYGDNQFRVTMGANIDPNIAGGKSIIDSICASRSKGFTGLESYTKSLQNVNGVKIRRVLDAPVLVDGEMLSQGYTLEEKIPWAAMNNPLAGVPAFVPVVKDTIGFDINIGDNDGMGRDREMAWKSYSDYMFQNPGFWGNIIFQADGSFTSDNDNYAPSPVTGLTNTIVGTEGTLNWDVSTDNKGYVLYKIFDTSGQWPVFLTQTETTSYKITTPIVLGTVLKYMVKAYDKANNESVAANITIKFDTQNPTPATNLVATKLTDTSIQLTWTAATDNDQLTSYSIYKNGVWLSDVLGTAVSARILKLVAGIEYTFVVVAKDRSGNISTDAKVVYTIQTAIKDIAESNIKIYPNPVKGLLLLTNSELISSIQILNIQGQIMLTSPTKLGNSMDVSALKNGNYFVKIKSINGEQYISKIVKD